MTITLGWWAFPLLIFIGGFIWAYISAHNDSGYLPGLGAGLILIGTIIATLSLIVGHFI